jgi:hypothetical protein
MFFSLLPSLTLGRGEEDSKLGPDQLVFADGRISREQATFTRRADGTGCEVRDLPSGVIRRLIYGTFRSLTRATRPFGRLLASFQQRVRRRHAQGQRGLHPHRRLVLVVQAVDDLIGAVEAALAMVGVQQCKGADACRAAQKM